MRHRLQPAEMLARSWKNGSSPVIQLIAYCEIVSILQLICFMLEVIRACGRQTFGQSKPLYRVSNQILCATDVHVRNFGHPHAV